MDIGDALYSRVEGWDCSKSRPKSLGREENFDTRAMLPAAADVLALRTITDVLRYLGMDRDLWNQFVKVVGDPQEDLRPLAALPKQVIVQGVSGTLTVTGGAVAAVQAAHVGLVWRVARYAVFLQGGGIAEDFKDVDPWAETVTATVNTGGSSKSSSVKDKVMKMSNVLDQADDSEAVPPEMAMVQSWTQRYLTVMGAYPDEDEEPTDLQMGALHRRVVELDQAPFVDFSVWQPYGRRALKAAKFRAFFPVGDGSYAVRELPGPQNMIQWTASWRVFKVAAISLGIVSLAALQVYERTIERLVLLWPDCWSLIVQADDKARGEKLDKIRRQLVADFQVGKSVPDDFTMGAPWSTCFRMVAQDDIYWNEQVRNPGTAWLAHGGRGAPKAPSETIASTHLPGGTEALDSLAEDRDGRDERRRQANRDKRAARKRRFSEQKDELSRLRGHGGGVSAGQQGGKSKGKGSGKDQSGKEICYSWAKGLGPCAGLAVGSECKAKVKRVHKCMHCLSPAHVNSDCPQAK